MYVSLDESNFGFLNPKYVKFVFRFKNPVQNFPNKLTGILKMYFSLNLGVVLPSDSKMTMTSVVG